MAGVTAASAWLFVVCVGGCRPALYKAVHEIVNLTRLGDANDDAPYQVVGPICETGASC